MEKHPDKELRRLEVIYRTFTKMNNEQRSRTLDFMISRYNQDLKPKKKAKR